MGLERYITGYFLAESVTLSKRWFVRAQTIEDATGKVLTYCKEELSILEKNNPLPADVEIDLRFTRIEDEVTEI